MDMSESHSVVVIGFGQDRTAVSRAIRDVPVRVHTVDDVAALRDAHQTLRPTCCITRAGDPSQAELVATARESAGWEAVPMLGVVAAPNREALHAVFALGVDDYVPADGLFALAPKIHGLIRGGAMPVRDHAACVVLADPSRARRAQLARQVRRLGLDVHFADNHLGVGDRAGVRLVVAAVDLPSVGAFECMRAFRRRTGRVDTPWIIVGDPGDHARVRTSLIGEPNVAWFPALGDPAQIVSVANRMLRRDAPSLRRSARLPLLAPALVELDDATSPLWSCTYNLSLGGVFLRTLVPPPVGTSTRVSFVVADGGDPLTLPGSVVWRVEARAAVGHPPGFGVKFEESMPERVREGLHRGYARLSKSQLAESVVHPRELPNTDGASP